MWKVCLVILSPRLASEEVSDARDIPCNDDLCHDCDYVDVHAYGPLSRRVLDCVDWIDGAVANENANTCGAYDHCRNAHTSHVFSCPLRQKPCHSDRPPYAYHPRLCTSLFALDHLDPQNPDCSDVYAVQF
jgi:hypothetical protein